MKGSTEGIWKTSGDRKRKKGHSREGSYQEGLQQRNYLDGWTKNMTKNTGQGWKGTGGDGKGKGVKNNGNDKERGGGSQTRKLRNKGVDRRR